MFSRIRTCLGFAFVSALTGCQERQIGAPGDVSAENLRQAISDPRVERVYALRGWRPAWDEGRAKDLTASLAEGDRHAISSRRLLEAAKAGATTAERESALTKAALTYADALANGTIDPRKVFDIYNLPVPAPDLSAELARALDENRVGTWLAGLAPADREYRALSGAYLASRARALGRPPQRVSPGPSLRPGEKDRRVPLIAANMRANGYLGVPSAGAQPASLYTPALARAVAQLQSDHGIEPDGIVGRRTIEALNVGPVDRARILAVALERRRWLERRPAPTRIDVNSGGAFLDYWRDGAHARRGKVVVGQRGWETPQISTTMTALVVHPPWTVPADIAEREILPKGPAYLRRNDMIMVQGRVIQRPGPKSALGLVKFDMPNPYSIYLHDTPAKQLFRSSSRHRSHGCARVEGAVDFARLIAGQDGRLGAFRQALASGEERVVSLSRAIPVRFLYHTAYLDGDRIVFRPDVYGWDEKVAAALGLTPKARAKPPAPAASRSAPERG